MADPAFNMLPADTRKRISALSAAVTAWPDPFADKLKMSVLMGYTYRCTDPADNPEFIAATAPALRAAFELIVQFQNVGTDTPTGQRGVITDHAYSVLDLRLTSTTGAPSTMWGPANQEQKIKAADTVDRMNSQVAGAEPSSHQRT